MEKEKIKLAIVSPNITNLGGVSRCVIILIEALNKKGIIPDYYGVYSNLGKIKELFNKDIKYNFKRIWWPKKAVLYSAWMKNFQLISKNYDYVFDFTNTLPLNQNKGKYFSYILYPEFLTSRGKYNKGLWRIYYLPHQILAFFQKRKFNKPNIDMACVSKKVSDIIFNIFGNRLPVLYPPSNLMDFKNKVTKKSGIISVGGLTHEKNQLEQIGIAKHFPKIEFSICGNAKRNPSYFKRLKNKAEELNNVKVYPNLSFKDLKKKIINSEIFLNSGREDPFCMALVEGIAAGCLPLIHNSGGITEIVPFEEFKYNNKEEAILKLKKILNLSDRKKKELRKKLQKHIEQFGERQFINQLFELINRKI